MSEELNVTEADNNQPNPNAELRAYADRMKEERDTMYREMMAFRLDALGLNANEGLGKAIAKEYDGDIALDALAKYVKDEYGYEAVEPTVDNDIVKAAQKRVDEVMGDSQPVTPEVEPDVQAQADQKLASEDATRQDAISSVTQKLALLNQE